MQVQRISNNNYSPNFQAVIRGRLNPRISDNVRAIVDKADSLYESIMGKKANINGVTVQPILEGVPSRTKEAVRLSKEIDGIKAELTINKPYEGTELNLRLTKPKSTLSTLIHYDSMDFANKKGHSFYIESLKTYISDGFHLICDVNHKGCKNYKTYAQNNAAFEKYAGTLLEPAEEIKKIFVG